MAILSPSSNFLVFTYAVALLSAFVAFGLVIGEGTDLSITGALSAAQRSCFGTGSVRCLASDIQNAQLSVQLENTLQEPVMLTRVRVGSCNFLDLHTRLEVGAQGSLDVPTCFDAQDYGAPISYELYSIGVFSGKTTVSSGNLRVS